VVNKRDRLAGRKWDEEGGGMMSGSGPSKTFLSGGPVPLPRCGSQLSLCDANWFRRSESIPPGRSRTDTMLHGRSSPTKEGDRLLSVFQGSLPAGVLDFKTRFHTHTHTHKRRAEVILALITDDGRVPWKIRSSGRMGSSSRHKGTVRGVERRVVVEAARVSPAPVPPKVERSWLELLP